MNFELNQISKGVDIYLKLPTKTETNNVIIKSVYGKDGVKLAKETNSVFSLRVFGSNKHFGNPFSSVKSVLDKNKDIIPCQSTSESVYMYITWVLYSSEPRAIWIREVLSSGILKNKSIIYYKELNEPSHANALDYLINNWSEI